MSAESKPTKNSAGATAADASSGAEGQIAVNGYSQVLEMLRIADPAFRESLLRRLAARDSELAYNLRRSLAADA